MEAAPAHHAFKIDVKHQPNGPQSYAYLAVETETTVEAIAAAVAMAKSPVRKHVMFVGPKSDRTIACLCSPEFLYVRHVTSPPATDNSARWSGSDRPMQRLRDSH